MTPRYISIAILALLISACNNTDIAPTQPVASDEAAYFVFNYRINNRSEYDSYLAAVPATLEAHSAEIIVADFESNVIEGNAGKVTVVLKFASEQAARDWHRSPQYQEIIHLRTENSTGIATIANSSGS